MIEIRIFLHWIILSLSKLIYSNIGFLCLQEKDETGFISYGHDSRKDDPCFGTVNMIQGSCQLLPVLESTTTVRGHLGICEATSDKERL
jgi:hypothetical protein